MENEIVEFNIEAGTIVFEPNVVNLKKAVELSKTIIVTDLRDRTQLEAVKRSRIDLRAMEIKIEDKGKELRANAVTYSKKVISEVAELKKITEPEIERLKDIEEEIKYTAIMDLRKADLPRRLEILAKIGDDIEKSDDELLTIDNEEFIAYVNERTANKNEKDRIENERIANEAQEKIDKERIALDDQRREIEKEEESKKQKEEYAKQAKEFADNLKIQEEKDKIMKEKEEKRKLSRKTAFIKFLSDNGQTEENKDQFFQKVESDRVILYKKVAEFNL